MMNKIYKVIWSKVKNCYVVASELAKRRTKAPKSEVISRVLVASILTTLFSFGTSMSVFAAAADTVTSSAANTTKLFLLGHTAAGTAAAKYDSNIYATTTAGQLHVGSLQSGGAISGTNATFTGLTLNSKAIVLGTNASSIGTTGDSNIVIGDNASATEGTQDVVIGHKSYSSAPNTVVIGDGGYATAEGAIRIGAITDDTYGVKGVANGLFSISLGYGTVANSDYAISIGGGSVVEDTAHASVSLGFGSHIYDGIESVAIGSNSIAHENYVVSFGAKEGDIDWEDNTRDNSFTRRLINVSDGIDDTDVSTVGQMHSYTTPTDNGNYVRSANTAAQNFVALDTQVKTNTDGLTTEITKGGLLFGSNTKATVEAEDGMALIIKSIKLELTQQL